MQIDVQQLELTPNERIRKNQLEAQIRIHLDSFWKCGDALCEIRESRLYREEYPTFEAYCDGRWRFSDRHARRLIFASKVVNEIGPIGPEITESHLREFAPLQPDEYQPTWTQVLEAAKDNKITAALVRRVVKAATSVTVEVVQTQGHVALSESSIPLIEAGITERMQEDMQRQQQHIADRTGRQKPTAVVEVRAVTLQALEAFADSLKDIASAEILRIVIYRVQDNEQPNSR